MSSTRRVALSTRYACGAAQHNSVEILGLENRGELLLHVIDQAGGAFHSMPLPHSTAVSILGLYIMVMFYFMSTWWDALTTRFACDTAQHSSLRNMPTG